MDAAKFEQLLKQVGSLVPTQRKKAPEVTLEQGKELFHLLANKRVASFKYNEFNKPVIEQLIKYFCNHEDCILDIWKGLWVYGPYGRGKSSLMDLFCEFCQVLNIRSMQFNFVQCRDITQKLNEKENPSVLKQFAMKSYCYDDLGREDLVYNNYGNRIIPMEFVLDYCQHQYRKIGTLYHVTTQIQPEQISEFYSERSGSIFYELFNPVNLAGIDFRKKGRSQGI